MKAAILLFLLFGYVNGDCSDECKIETQCPSTDTECNNDAADGCSWKNDGCFFVENCDRDLDMQNWEVDYIGKSTQFRIYDPCNNKFIKFKMEDLTEYEGDKKTNNKETSFASSKDWTMNYTRTGDKIINTFVADTLTKMDQAIFTLETIFFRDTAEIPDPDDTSQNITVGRNTFKFNVIVENWQTLTDGNQLELCIGVMTNEPGKFNLNGDKVENGVFRFSNPEIADCEGTEINVATKIGGNDNNQLDFCYKFEACDGAKTITYDPIVEITPSAAANYMSVFVVATVAIMSLFFV